MIEGRPVSRAPAALGEQPDLRSAPSEMNVIVFGENLGVVETVKDVFTRISGETGLKFKVTDEVRESMAYMAQQIDHQDLLVWVGYGVPGTQGNQHKEKNIGSLVECLAGTAPDGRRPALTNQSPLNPGIRVIAVTPVDEVEAASNPYFDEQTLEKALLKGRVHAQIYGPPRGTNVIAALRQPADGWVREEFMAKLSETVRNQIKEIGRLTA
ncbi:Uncharacterised protein [uncultured archaeon]|nr:Uncharacterised protein [uncultured archaeon]